MLGSKFFGMPCKSTGNLLGNVLRRGQKSSVHRCLLERSHLALALEDVCIFISLEGRTAIPTMSTGVESILASISFRARLILVVISVGVIESKSVKLGGERITRLAVLNSLIS